MLGGEREMENRGDGKNRWREREGRKHDIESVRGEEDKREEG